MRVLFPFKLPEGEGFISQLSSLNSPLAALHLSSPSYALFDQSPELSPLTMNLDGDIITLNN